MRTNIRAYGELVSAIRAAIADRRAADPGESDRQVAHLIATLILDAGTLNGHHPSAESFAADWSRFRNQ